MGLGSLSHLLSVCIFLTARRPDEEIYFIGKMNFKAG